MAETSQRSKEDTVEYYLIPSIPDRIKDEEVQGYIEEQLDAFLAHLSPFLIEYIWQCEPFSLSPVVGKGNLPPHLYGSTNFGENIDDEWFIVYLLFRLSRAYPNLVIKTSDSDGEFLLIEAAEALPKWLTPETSENRVYIYEGNVHIIPIPQTPGEMLTLPLFAPDMPDGIKCIREQTSLTRASPQVQRAINSRLRCFPEKIRENIHHSNCYLPAKLVKVLSSKPALVAPAVHAFFYRDPIDLQACRTMQLFPPDKRVLTRVKFTRCLYAQLLHQQFTPDRRSGYTLPASSNPSFTSHDLGTKLAHGFEILCSKCSSGQRMGMNGHSNPTDRDVRWQRYLKSLNMSGYFRDEVSGSKQYTQLLEDARKFYMEHLKTSTDSETFRTSPGEEVIDLIGSSTFDLESLRRQEKSLPPSDDDSWLNLTPEGLDDILKKSSGGSDPDNFDMSKVADSMKEFVSHVSGIEGAEFPQEAEEGEIQFESTGFIHAMQKMFEFNDDDDASSSDMSEYDWDESDDELRAPSKKSARKPARKSAPKKDPKIQNVMDMMDRELAKTDVGKSFERDSPKQNGNTKPNKPQRPRQPPPPRPTPTNSNTSSPAKPSPSPSARPSPPPRPPQRPPQRPPRRPPPRPNNTPTSSPKRQPRDIDDEDDDFVPVNINLNVVKNTLESYSAQQGLPGPATNILHSMGIKLPANADASNSKTTTTV